MSFESLRKWKKELEDKGPKELLLVIAANKEDLVSDEAVTLN